MKTEGYLVWSHLT